MANNQNTNVPPSWDQNSQDDYSQLPQQAANLNIGQRGNTGYQAGGYGQQQYFQQQQQQQQPPQQQQQYYNNYYTQYSPQQGYYHEPTQPPQTQQQFYQQPEVPQSQQPYQPRINTQARFAAFRQAPGTFSAQAAEFRPSFTPRSQQQPVSQPIPPPTGPRATTSASGARVLSIGGSSKPASSGPKVLSLSSTKPAADKAESKAETKAETKNVAKSEEKASSEPAAATEVKPADVKSKEESGKAAPKATTAPTSDSAAGKDLRSIEVADDSHKIDEETLHDMYGKEHMSIIFMGHVDAGKSTMGGNLLFLTGTVDKRTMEKFEKEAKDAGRESWYLSWVLDQTKEERSKGKTVEVGRGFFETDKRRYTLLDAPGHKTYVPSMIGGASQADVGILVISARKGEYETGFERGGQTREHAVLAKNQGVDRLIIAVNKMDDPTVNWSKERYDECTSKLASFLKNLGYKSSDVQFMPVSAYSGVNLKDRVDPKTCPWYSGPSLLEYLDNLPLNERKLNAPFMMPVGAKYRDLGTVVEGKIESGMAKRGSNLVLMPNKVSVEVLTIYNETEAETEAALCGEQVKFRLKGVEEEDVQIGFVLSSVEHPVHTVTAFEAQIAIIELKSILTAGFTCVIHVHTAVEEVTFSALLAKLQKGTNRLSKKPPAFATKGMKIMARLELVSTTGFCIERFEDYPQLGRFTLRDQGNTIAIGKVTKLL
ncbi:P-loop containing nucleoside triphosphate hydrolase protein [Lipomyces oligophaga]|uniref:P-loop containing nucleoside triphosphate hydrolase protein n=1 Tax=Lipomyces oligophaga TaxID=45792 RepID=UPI0034CFA287